jgi:hypothetical protein
MAADPDVPGLRAVRLLGDVLHRLPGFPDAEKSERAALAALWALGQYRIPEAKGFVEAASSYPSKKVAAFARKMAKR